VDDTEELKHYESREVMIIAVFALHRIDNSVALLKSPSLSFEKVLRSLFDVSAFLISMVLFCELLRIIDVLFPSEEAIGSLFQEKKRKRETKKLYTTMRGT